MARRAEQQIMGLGAVTVAAAARRQEFFHPSLAPETAPRGLRHGQAKRFRDSDGAADAQASWSL